MPKKKEVTNEKLIRTDKIILDKKTGDKAFDFASKQSNNIYNLTMYYIRQSYFYGLEKDDTKLLDDVKNTVKFLNEQIKEYNQVSTSKDLELITKDNYPMYNYYFLRYLIKKLPNERFPEGEVNPFYLLPSTMAQNTVEVACKSWKGYFAALKEWNKNKKGFTGKPKMPKYKKKGSNSFLYASSNGFSVKEGEIHLAKKMFNFKLTREDGTPKQVRALPRKSHYILEVVYEIKNSQENIDKLNNYELKRCISIDLGIDNLATVTNNVGLKSFIIDGKLIKSINQYYNKQKAKAMSYIGDKGFSNRTLKLDLKRNNMISDKIHKSSKYIVDYCVENDIDTIIIGYNSGWKTEVDMGKVQNQKFVNIPYEKFVSQITYKSEEKGIKVNLIKEHYTSKCDALSLEEIKKHGKYKGKREKRGKFISGTGHVINADINGSLNIMRLWIGDDFMKKYKEKLHLLTPHRVSIT